MDERDAVVRSSEQHDDIDVDTSSILLQIPDDTSASLARWSPMSVRIHIDSQFDNSMATLLSNRNNNDNIIASYDQLLAVARCDSRAESLPDEAMYRYALFTH